MQTIQTWLSWLPFMGGGMLALVVVLALLGVLPAVMKVLETVLAVVGPILNVAGKAVADAVSWVGYNILGPGLKDILEDWVTVVTVLLMGATLWFYMDLKETRLEKRMQAQLTQCQMTVKTLKKCVGRPQPVAPAPKSGWSLF